MLLYNDFNSYLRGVFGCRVQKISLDAGFTCPNRDGKISYGGCIYCNEKGSGTGAYKRGISITSQLESAKLYMTKRYKAKKFLAYFQSFSNTYAPIEKLQNVYDEALAVADVIGMSIGTRPDCIDSQIADLLESYAKKHLIWVEYGLQSMHNHTLKLINRGHDRQTFIDAVKLMQNRNIKICAHVILGLPGETSELMLQTANFISQIGVDGVKLHLLYVIKNTPLEHMLRNNSYICLSQRQYAEIVCDFLELLPKNIVVQRLTGDPHPEELVAPDWALKKNENLNLIHSILESRNSFQGKYAVL